MLVPLLNLGALVGGLYFGALSERIGRRKAMIIAALLAIPVIPLWMHGGSLLLALLLWLETEARGVGFAHDPR